MKKPRVPRRFPYKLHLRESRSAFDAWCHHHRQECPKPDDPVLISFLTCMECCRMKEWGFGARSLGNRGCFIFSRTPCMADVLFVCYILLMYFLCKLSRGRTWLVDLLIVVFYVLSYFLFTLYFSTCAIICTSNIISLLLLVYIITALKGLTLLTFCFCFLWVSNTCFLCGTPSQVS